MSQNVTRRSFIAGTAAASLTAGAVATTVSSAAHADEASAANATVLSADNVSDVKWSFEIAPEPVDESEITAEVTADVIVIGAGISGMATALSASESGVDVRIVTAGETATGRGGSNNGVGTKYQAELGIDYTPENAWEYVRFQQVVGGYRVDKRKWSRWLANSAESIEWMLGKAEEQGYKICIELPYEDPDGLFYVPPSAHNLYTEDVPLGPVTGAGLQVKMYLQCLDEAGVPIDYGQRAKYLLREDGGRVTGFVAQNLATGEYTRYLASKAVVLATGDFSKNRDMMAAKAPFLYESFKDVIAWDVDDGASLDWAESGATKRGLFPGDGQKMGLWIGAAWQKCANCGQLDSSENGPVRNAIGNFAGINLASDGKRFMNENTNFYYGAQAILSLPDHTVFTIWDDAYADTQEMWPVFPQVTNGVNGIPGRTPDEERANWEAKGYTKADTLEELLEALGGIDVEVALASIAHYNECAKAGYDDEFQVNPELLFPIETGPFWGFRRDTHEFLTVCGGLRTDEHMRVCDADDQPIPGLYNVGTMIGDFFANDYNFVMAGINLGACCCTFPYLLGRELAEL